MGGKVEDGIRGGKVINIKILCKELGNLLL